MTTKSALLAAIRQNCLGCAGGSPSEVAHCTVKSCTLHGFRFGKDPAPARGAPAASFGRTALPGRVISAGRGKSG
jgi:hypothetical protein